MLVMGVIAVIAYYIIFPRYFFKTIREEYRYTKQNQKNRVIAVTTVTAILKVSFLYNLESQKHVVFSEIAGHGGHSGHRILYYFSIFSK